MSWIDRLLGHEDAQAAGPARIKTLAPSLSKRTLASLQPVVFGVMAQGTARRRPP